MKKNLVMTLFIVALLLLAACAAPELPEDIAPEIEQVDPVIWSTSISPPPLTEDAFHLVSPRGDKSIYLYLGMTREYAQDMIPSISDQRLTVFPEFGYIGFDDNDRIDRIMVMATATSGFWVTPSGIALGDDWSDLDEWFDAIYDRYPDSDSSLRIHFTRNHVPVHLESEGWEYRSYNVLFTNDSDRIWAISIRSRTE